MELVAPQLAAAPAEPLVLVVDDSRSMREGLAAVLHHAGYRVDTAANGREGLAKAREISPDLILSDLEMPEANGFELLSGVRSDGALAMVPFVMITGVSDRSSTRRAMELGADDYLTKPFTPDEVQAVVRSRFEKQRNWRQATHALAASYSQGMMGVLPHEFRTPLNSILGFAELMTMMADQGLSPQQTREFAEVIQRAGRTLLNHTTRFLTLMEYQGTAALPADGTPDHFVLDPHWLRALADSILDNQLPGSQVHARIDLPEATVHCREPLLTTMLTELLGNAVKFADPDSTIVISGQVAASRYILHIDNVGRPFPLDRLGEVGAFVQFDRERHEQQGLGIGLALVTQAARLSQSTLDISNLPPHTVRLSLHIPLA